MRMRITQVIILSLSLGFGTCCLTGPCAVEEDVYSMTAQEKLAFGRICKVYYFFRRSVHALEA